MNCLFEINPAKLRNHVKMPHSTPAFEDENSKSQLLSLISDAHDELEALICSEGFVSSHSPRNDETFDFYMNDDVGLFKMISLEIKTDEMVSRELLLRIFKWLKEYHDEFSVFITNEFDDSLELFFIVVTCNAILGEFESSTTAGKFGFDPNSPNIGPIG